MGGDIKRLATSNSNALSTNMFAVGGCFCEHDCGDVGRGGNVCCDGSHQPALIGGTRGVHTSDILYGIGFRAGA